MVRQQDGFVLPYVLLVIAILSLSIMIVAERIDTMSKLITIIDESSQADIAIASAEAELIYAYLTAVPIKGGMNLNPSAGVDFGITKNTKDDDASVADLWSAAGGRRMTKTSYGPVIVTYRDISGFVPINSGDNKLVRGALRYLGASSDKAESLSAKLSDYTDRDVRRQFRGGERADYRMKNKPAPTNSPLRKFEELKDVLEWEGFLNDVGLQNLKDIATLTLSNTAMKARFAEPSLAEAFGLNVANVNTIKAITGLNEFPTDVGRFVLEAQISEEDMVQQSLEIRKTIGHKQKPFEVFFVYKTVKKSPSTTTGLLDVDGLKHVIHSETYRAE